MKNSFKIIITSLILIIAGCKDNLEEVAYASLYTKDFYKDAGQNEAALTSVYGSLQDLSFTGAGCALFLPAEWAADVMFPRNVVGRSSYTTFSYEPFYAAQASQGGRDVQEGPVGIWQHSYAGIEKANWIIRETPNANMPFIRRNEIVGEALFMRALFHFFLVKNFGDVPIKITPTDEIEKGYVKNSPKADVYKQIYADLAKAIPAIPSFDSRFLSGSYRGRPSKEAAQLLMAKAALYGEDWNKALSYADSVIISGKYQLMPNVLDVFDVTKKNTARIENIFAVEHNGNLVPYRISGMPYFTAPQGGVQYSKGGVGSQYVFASFFNSFEVGDKRKAFLDTVVVEASGRIRPRANIDTRFVSKDLVILGKYKDPNAIGPQNSNNLPILRYPDAFLIAAEAEARLNGGTAKAYNYINSVRKRAGIADLKVGLGKEAFIDAVIMERKFEFFGEGDRWYDLTRTDKFLTEVPKAVNADYKVRTPLPKHKYFPIPQIEVNANPLLKQNPLW
jgi:starch-binding outer membrane protein, SusD/RagB family